MPRSSTTVLKELDQLRSAYGEGRAALKISLLRELERADLKRPRDLCRLHDILCFLAAYPDNAESLSLARKMLEGFARRRDLKRLRKSLAGTGIAGTETCYPFFAPTARWLVETCPRQLTVNWGEFESSGKLEELLHLLALYCETPGLDEYGFTAQEWIGLLKGPEETDAAFLVKRFDAMKLGTFAWETLYNGLSTPMRLSGGGGAPSRTGACYPVSEIAFQRGPLDRSRPKMPGAAKKKPVAVIELPAGEGRRLTGLARTMMVAFNRELDAFSYASSEDASLVDCGRGLSFAFLGTVPERRLLFESVYGFLVLKNGVPIGYGTVSSLFGSSEIAFNVFEPYRGCEAASIFVQLMAASRFLFGSDTFTLYPYQLGQDNQEAIRSGAWWFYQKLGFRPREPEILELMKAELARMKQQRGYRSPPATLRKLAGGNVYLHLGRERDDVVGMLPIARAGLAVTEYVALRFGSNREKAASVCAREAAVLLGAPSGNRGAAGRRLAWERWSPVVMALPGVERWPDEEKAALAGIIDAKGGQREREYVLRFDRHRRLRQAVRKMAGRVLPE